MANQRIVRSVDSVQLYPSRAKSVGHLMLALLGLVVLPAVIVLMTVGLTVKIAAGVLLVLVVGNLAMLIPRMARPRPLLTIDVSGITDNTGFATPGFVPWEQIIGVEAWRITGTGTWRTSALKFVALTVRDPQALLAEVGPVKRSLMRANALLTHSPVNIVMTLLPMSPDELIQEIVARRPG